MGKRTREYDWSDSPVGSPDHWPQSLRTTVSNLLRSRFPMFLWWGKEMTQFYNDAYRPSLGNNGKHPFALGQKGRECWPEIWEIIYPLLEQVETTGEATWREDQLVPIYRNGKIEDVYWTYSYSSVLDDEGRHAGILVTCVETTEKVMNQKQLEESEEQLRFAIEATELATWDFNPATKTFKANKRYLDWFGFSATGEIEIEQALNVIAQEDRERVKAFYQKVLDPSWQPRYDITFTIRPTDRPERIVRAKGKVWFNKENIANRFNGTLQDVTEQIINESNNQKQVAIIEASHEFIGLAGADSSAQYVNPAGLKMLGWDSYENKKILDCVFPEDRELANSLIPILFEKGHFSHEIRFMNSKTGEPFWLLWNAFAIRDSITGEITGLATVSPDITERKKTVESLKESEKNLRNIIIQAPVAMCILLGPDHVVEIANDRMFELWGKSSENMLHKPIIVGLPEIREQGFQELLNDVYTTGKSYTAIGVPVTLIRNGITETVFVNFVYEAYRQTDTSIAGVMVVATEVTEQVHASKKIEESEQQVRSLVESAPFPIGVYIGREMRIALVNQSILDTWGKGPDLLGKRYAEVLPELESQSIYEQLDKVYTTGIPYHAKNQRVDLVVNGKLQPFYFNYSFTPLFDATGNVYGVMNTAADVTDLNIAKQKVEESERNFRRLVMQAPVGICIVNKENLMVEIVNDSFLEIAGKRREVLEKKSFWDAVPEVATFYEPILNNVFTTGNTYYAQEHEIMLIRDNKPETVYVNFVYDPIKEEDGIVSKVMMLVIEITPQVLARRKIEEIVTERTRELAQANEALLHTNQELARSNQNLEEFAYAASHDLKEPIRKIHFFSDRIKASLNERFLPEETRYFSRMEEASKRMSLLIDDLLSYSQVGLKPKTVEEVNMNNLIKMVLSDLDLEIEQKQATITTDPLFITKGHYRQLQQAFQNLLANALKYNRPNVRPDIRIRYKMLSGNDVSLPLLAEQRDRDYHLIQVIDNGIGFEQQDAERIFNVFTRLHGNSEYRGTGVGLSIAQRVVKNHNGHIWAQSQPGVGSVFNVLLPVL